MTNYSKWDKFAAELDSDTDKEEERQLKDYTQKQVCYIHVPPGDFIRKEQLCKLLEEDADFEPPSSNAAGVCGLDGDEVEPAVARALKKYGWESIGSQFIPGYGTSSQSDDCWRVYFDDNFLTTQKLHNRAARALLGYESRGSFVLSCFDRSAGKDRPISIKEVSDLIIRRQSGADAEKIDVEHQSNKKSMEMFEKLGVENIELKPP